MTAQATPFLLTSLAVTIISCSCSSLLAESRDNPRPRPEGVNISPSVSDRRHISHPVFDQRHHNLSILPASAANTLPNRSHRVPDQRHNPLSNSRHVLQFDQGLQTLNRSRAVSDRRSNRLNRSHVVSDRRHNPLNRSHPVSDRRHNPLDRPHPASDQRNNLLNRSRPVTDQRHNPLTRSHPASDQRHHVSDRRHNPNIADNRRHHLSPPDNQRHNPLNRSYPVTNQDPTADDAALSPLVMARYTETSDDNSLENEHLRPLLLEDKELAPPAVTSPSGGVLASSTTATPNRGSTDDAVSPSVVTLDTETTARSTEHERLLPFLPEEDETRAVDPLVTSPHHHAASSATAASDHESIDDAVLSGDTTNRSTEHERLLPFLKEEDETRTPLVVTSPHHHASSATAASDSESIDDAVLSGDTTNRSTEHERLLPFLQEEDETRTPIVVTSPHHHASSATASDPQGSTVDAGSPSVTYYDTGETTESSQDDNDGRRVTLPGVKTPSAGDRLNLTGTFVRKCLLRNRAEVALPAWDGELFVDVEELRRGFDAATWSGLKCTLSMTGAPDKLLRLQFNENYRLGMSRLRILVAETPPGQNVGDKAYTDDIFSWTLESPQWDRVAWSSLGRTMWISLETSVNYFGEGREPPLEVRFRWLTASAIPQLETAFLTSTVDALPRCGVTLNNAGVGSHVLRTGSIGTPGCDGVKTFHVHSHPRAASLHVPPGYIVILSVAHDAGCVWGLNRFIRFYRPNIDGFLEYCQLTFPLRLKTPSIKMVLPGQISFRGLSSTGFQLWFTFHEESAAVPTRLDEQWNCSGLPDWAPFQRHFPCNLHADCLGLEDEASCPYTSAHCGPGQFTADGKCYKFISVDEENDGISWIEAEVDCRSRSGRLASLNSAREWQAVQDVVKTYARLTSHKLTFVGLKTAPENMPLMAVSHQEDIEKHGGSRVTASEKTRQNRKYRKAWQHSDGSMAYYAPIVRFYVISLKKPACLTINIKKERLSFDKKCQERWMFVNYICERGETPGAGSRPSPLMVTEEHPARERRSSLFGSVRFVACPQQHVTHNFLSCDVQSACWGHYAAASFSSCASPVTPLPPSFLCDDGAQSAPYTFVCDFRSDCQDNSDEDFCVHRLCDPIRQFGCDNGQCFPLEALCDDFTHCLDGSDEAQCPTMPDLPMSNITTAVVVSFKRNTFTFTPWVNTSSGQALVCPVNHFACSSNIYCLPVFMRCNQVFDCPGREDEAGCAGYTCPGLYRCRDSQVCVSDAEMCDKQFHCPQRDDELLCQLRCPHGCTCHGLAFFCHSRVIQVGDFPSLTYLDATGSGLRPDDVTNNSMLVHLSLGACGLRDGPGPLLSLPNLRSLDLRGNHLTEVTGRHLARLPNLRALSLADNPLVSIFTERADVLLRPPAPLWPPSATLAPPSLLTPPTGLAPPSLEETGLASPAVRPSTIAPPTMGPPSVGSNSLVSSTLVTLTVAPPTVAPSTLVPPTLVPHSPAPPEQAPTPTLCPRLHILDLSGVRMTSFSLSALDLFPNLRVLNLSGTGLDALSGAGSDVPTNLRALDVRGCPLTYFPADLLRNLSQLRDVWADTYKLCCLQTLPPGFNLARCRAPADEISSCENLLRSDLYRICLAVFAAMSLLGNFAAFVSRLALGKVKNGFDVFTLTLCVSDFLMGLYLAVIGVADRVYLSSYLWNDVTWRRSGFCSAAGFLSLVSNEVSAFVVCLITLDRFLVLRFPFSKVRFTRTSGLLVSCGVWLIGAALASVPLLPATAHWQFYSLNGICVPLPVTRKEFPGRGYSFGLMVVLNFVLFLLIAVGQLFVYLSVQKNSLQQETDLASRQAGSKERDARLARRLIAVAMSDFLCWFPIGLLGILSSSGIPISGEVNVAMAIFVLPLNSAINPYLYTVNKLLEKRTIRNEKRLMEVLMKRLKHGSASVAATTHRA